MSGVRAPQYPHCRSCQRGQGACLKNTLSVFDSPLRHPFALLRVNFSKEQFTLRSETTKCASSSEVERLVARLPKCGGNSAVECFLAKEDVGGSTPLRRSKTHGGQANEKVARLAMTGTVGQAGSIPVSRS